MKKPTYAFTILIVLFFIVGCSSDVEVTPYPTNTVVPTDTPVPTNTPTPVPTDTPVPTATIIPTATPIPLSELNLESLLIQSGDLPAGYSGAQISDVASQFDTLPVAENEIEQQFESNDEFAGIVAVFLYDEKAEVDEAYKLLSDNFGKSSIEYMGVGEASVAESGLSPFGGNTITSESTRIVFTRCNAVIYIKMFGIRDVDSITAYARRLDRRLEPVICQYDMP